ncbi:rhomboid family intramembrane serine protease [Frigidibacter sp. ROC022]|uniref:rhomboid family intramembrane serine protease n=1 Tax=Frigidibacter sp. ROC022 TaxID=2971796 RepID=UPI00215A7FE8|nr:rhomboid family intramembrane serine protease [Frigidibacter sp. ROC022]MCR8726777.1 rhomboid family intramembrane serine protease [Frigidibacter sp. ROC022]
MTVSAPSSGRPDRLSWILALALALPELVLLGADHGLWGAANWRPLAYSFGGFWAGLLHGWQPNFPGQAWTMFVTYGFLHAGPVHLLGNLGALAYLTPSVRWRVGPAGFLAIWIAAWLGGAAMFGLLSRQAAPMVGASGALFGLAGAWVVFVLRERLAAGMPPRRTVIRAAGAALVLVLLNIADWWMQSGRLAWQTHLGGALAGGLVAAMMGRGRRGGA